MHSKGTLISLSYGASGSVQPKILYWCQDTALVPFESGIQRVVRRLAAGLAAKGAAIIPVGWDNRSRQIVCLPTAVRPGHREPPTLEKLIADGAFLFVPEIPLSLIKVDLDPIQLGRAYGLRTVAFIHDLIPIKLAKDYDAGAVRVYRRYYRQFANADLVLATTNYVAGDLREFLLHERLPVPKIEVEPLPAEFSSLSRNTAAPPSRTKEDPLRLLTVTTWEPRKNLPRLLRAVGRASEEGHSLISLDLVGRRGGFENHDDDVLAMAAKLATVDVHGAVSDAELVALYARCHASIYPSVEEGFGLPILESLWLGRPCLCHDGSSMAEVAPGGGTIMIDMTDEDVIVDTLKRFVATPDLVGALAREAAARPLADWDTFAGKILQKISCCTEPARSRR